MSIKRREPGQPPFRVLCVDDYRDCADSVVMLMEAMGFEARACYEGHSALDLNESFRPSLCFIDLNMPGMDGDALVKQLLSQAVWRPLLLVAMTAMDDEKSRNRTRAAGFHMHLVKPVNPQKMIDVVDALFRATDSVNEDIVPPSEVPGGRNGWPV